MSPIDCPFLKKIPSQAKPSQGLALALAFYETKPWAYFAHLYIYLTPPKVFNIHKKSTIYVI
jgi:hypothetical protein